MRHAFNVPWRRKDRVSTAGIVNCPEPKLKSRRARELRGRARRSSAERHDLRIASLWRSAGDVHATRGRDVLVGQLLGPLLSGRGAGEVPFREHGVRKTDRGDRSAGTPPNRFAGARPSRDQGKVPRSVVR
ncbi:uncharacterized protein SCHCODRAFT_01328008 [Schizophyllum commune H4-8]|uniref:uncharacterized protein n=1 Tax=Schizophyllum commune (strain H4-8 / FGSC 9210) TaxID=578458 RepID=UPI00215F030B|nr:uncharacterized protein SCHCODRAFT_01328008 [Schizophyllum commune H4-8]KAI5889741.1 hypothetical protein SCHCODRAFT_01328008 [Schizophyllum commune H4-8]